MKTILYDIELDQPISQEFIGGYFVDGEKPALPQNIIELEVKDVEIPTYDDKLQKISSQWQRNGNYWEYISTIIDKTIDEMRAEQQWDFEQYPLRISMTFEDWTNLITDIPDMALMVTNFKDSIINRNDRKYIYLSEIYSEHEAIFINYQSYKKENRI